MTGVDKEEELVRTEKKKAKSGRAGCKKSGSIYSGRRAKPQFRARGGGGKEGVDLMKGKGRQRSGKRRGGEEDVVKG